MENRRDFLKKVGALGSVAALSSLPAKAFFNQSFPENENILQGKLIHLNVPQFLDYIEPLHDMNISSSSPGTIRVIDGNGNEYFNGSIDNKASFKVAGALGTQLILLLDKKNHILDMAAFLVDTKTGIQDKDEEFSKMMKMLEYSCRQHGPGYYRVDGKTVKTYAGWFQDHTHVFKAMKYFDREVKSGFDLWAEGQREDGMMADNFKQSWGSFKSWLSRFGEQFVWTKGEKDVSSSFYIRIPVENMSEFTFLEGIYYAWKATGDDAWMTGKLDNCIKAVKYATSDDYRWSEKYQLLKRGYTIDIWDFQPAQDVKVWGGDIMMAKPGVTEYSIMYGDNVGMSVGCKYLAEMLEYAGRTEEAKKYKQLGEDLLERLNKIAWNGEFYTHHVPEDPSYVRDFGNTPVDIQVTISNAYAINRRIGHEKAKAIIETYQRIRKEMPKSSPGEWYMCYPPFEKGWHNPKWEYMNGGVSSIVGGEVAHGAFENGFEAYGVDCLRRLNDMAQLSDNFMKCIYRGEIPTPPVRHFEPLSLKDIANADTHGTGSSGVPGFTGEGVNDLSRFPTGQQVFQDVPFELIDPVDNGRKACLIISQDEGYLKKTSLPVNKVASSFYIVHACGGGRHIGKIVLNYADGSHHVTYIDNKVNIAGWWYPEGNVGGDIKLAASVSNEKSLSVGAYVFGFNNPQRDKTISSIDFIGAEAPGKWIILALTSSDYPVYYTPSPVSYGAPDNWGAAAIIYALVEGLAGMKDTGIAYNQATLAPRWEAAGVEEVSATAKYEASKGYLTYHYKKLPEKGYMVSFTGNSDTILFKLLLPDNATISKVILNGQTSKFTIEKIESSLYLVVQTQGVKAHEVEVRVS